MTFADLQNRVAHLIREPGPDTGDTYPLVGDFSLPTVSRDLNIALQIFISRTGSAPVLTDKVVTEGIVPGLDFQLPADLNSLARVEYQQASGGVTFPYPLNGYSLVDFDRMTGSGDSLSETGAPYSYREPYAGLIRLNPQPVQANADAGDTITLYYSSLGNFMVSPSDTPGIPVQYHMALVYYCLADYWPRKDNDQRGLLYEKRFEALVMDAKAYYFTSNPSDQPTIQDDDLPSFEDFE